MTGTRRPAVWLGAAALTLFAASATGRATDGSAAGTGTRAEAPRQTQGQAQSVLARVVPYVGLPGTTTSVGLTGSQVEGDVARASAAAADFGLLGALASAGTGGAPAVPGVPAPSLPTPITADSTGRTSVERNPFAPTGAAEPGADPTAAASPGELAYEKVSATEDPTVARAEVTGPELRVPGLLEITGGLSRTVADATRSLSEVTIDRIDLGGGQVELTGLRWTATQAGGKAGISTFALRGLTVAGEQLPVEAPEQLAAGLEQANEALTATGLVLSAPVERGGEADAAVAPLILQVRNPEPLVEPSRQAAEAVKPALAPLVEGLIAAYPDAAAAQIVANAATGALGGSSGGRLELGGVSARSALVEVLDLGQPIPDLPAGPVADAVPPSIPDSAPAPAADVPGPATDDTPAPGLDFGPSTGATAPAPAPLASGTGGPTDQGGTGMVPSSAAVTAAANTASAGSSGPGAGALALGIGLLAVVLLAAGDRVRMRAGA